MTRATISGEHGRLIRNRSRLTAALLAVVGMALAVALDSRAIMIATLAMIAFAIIGTRVYLIARYGPPQDADL